MCIFAHITLALILLRTFTSANLEPINCKIIADEAPLYKLKNHLFCDYDPTIRPGHGSQNSTVIDVMILPQYTTFDKYSSNLHIHSWLYIEFKDPFLTWKPDEHDEIKKLNVRRSDIWIPELYSMNPSKGELAKFPNTVCKLTYTGQIVCIGPFHYVAACNSDYTHWPWDVHNCTLQLGAWAYVDEEITFSNDTFIVIDRYRFTEEWKISLPQLSIGRKKSRLSSNATFPTFTVSVLLSRTHTALKSVIISPVIILTVVTMTVLWLRPGSTERLILSCINLLSHELALRSLNWILPDTGNHLPNILIFYTNSLILSTIAVVLTCWLQKLLECKREVPAFLEGLVSVILMSKVGQALSMNVMDPQGSALLQEHSDDTTTLVNFQPKTSKWEGVVTVISWLSLSTFGFTYFVMSIALLT